MKRWTMWSLCGSLQLISLLANAEQLSRLKKKEQGSPPPHVFAQTLDEAASIISVARGYDLIYGSPCLFVQDKEGIEEDMWGQGKCVLCRGLCRGRRVGSFGHPRRRAHFDSTGLHSASRLRTLRSLHPRRPCHRTGQRTPHGGRDADGILVCHAAYGDFVAEEHNTKQVRPHVWFEQDNDSGLQFRAYREDGTEELLAERAGQGLVTDVWNETGWIWQK